MKTALKTEEAMMLVLAVYLNTFLSYDAWLYWVLFLTPDIGLLGYTINPAVGALTYNTLHHKGVAILIYILGAVFSVELLQFTGLLLFGHSSFDRIFGYGLKYADGFHNTHLGLIGKSASLG
jgi:membrane protein required for beta-lactamase induction